jgi:dienelactone hydrolase
MGTVVFAHGTDSSRLSPRNRHVAAVLRASGLDTVLLDLLTPEEGAADARTGQHRFDIGMLTARVSGAVDWALARGDGARIGLFGASTGAAAALAAAAVRPVSAVVSRGGRPDLAGSALPDVAAPTLLIVGGRDHVVLDLNREAMAAMTAYVELAVVPGATHLFEEPGALDEVARLTADWFLRHLTG